MRRPWPVLPECETDRLQGLFYFRVEGRIPFSQFEARSFSLSSSTQFVMSTICDARVGSTLMK
jgi:hypothetical protein